MHHLSLVEPCDGLQPDVRVRCHVHRLAVAERQWAKAVEEAPWPHEAPILDGQCARNRQCAKIHFTIRIRVELRLAAPSAMHSSAAMVSERLDMVRSLQTLRPAPDITQTVRTRLAHSVWLRYGRLRDARTGARGRG